MEEKTTKRHFLKHDQMASCLKRLYNIKSAKIHAKILAVPGDIFVVLSLFLDIIPTKRQG
jgi:hypothetical protein